VILGKCNPDCGWRPPASNLTEALASAQRHAEQEGHVVTVTWDHVFVPEWCVSCGKRSTECTGRIDDNEPVCPACWPKAGSLYAESQ
jgi:hypothetical protein